MKKLLLILIFLIFTNYSYSQWVSNLNFQGSGDNGLSSAKGEAVTSDNSGNTYVTGYYYDPIEKNNIFTTKYSPSGDTLWNRFYNGTANDEDKAFGIVVDADGFVYVTGTTTSIGTSYDILLLKYDSNGILIWERKYSATNTPLEDKAFGIVVDSDGNIIITGYCTNLDGFTDVIVLKYDGNGNILWLAMEDGSDNKDSQGLAVTMDDSKNYYITGFTTSSSEGEDIVLLKYDTSGDRKFLKTVKGPAKKNERGLGITVDNNDYILICGYVTMNTNLKTALCVVKFDNSGSKKWDKTYNNIPTSTDRALGIVVDSDNYVYVTGYTGGSDSLCNILTLRYNSSGNLVWAKTHNGTGNGNDVAEAIGYMNNGINQYIIVAAKSWGIHQNYDLTVMRYKTIDGYLESVNTYSYSEETNDIPNSLDISADNSVLVTGYSELIVEAMLPPSYVTTMKIKYCKSTELNSDPNLPSNYNLYQNTPNPFNPSTTIKFDLIKPSHVKISIYDILGRTVDVLYNSHLNAGTHTINYMSNKLSSGIYFYELKTDDFKDIKKMTLIK